MKYKLILLVPILGLLASCAQDSLSGDVYSRSEARSGQSVQSGRITNIRYVKIEGGNQGGALLGGLAGGALGSNIGNGRASNTAGAVGGALTNIVPAAALETGRLEAEGAGLIVRISR